MALATAFVDDPTAPHKSHKKPVPYLGGIGLIAGVLVALLFTSHLTAQVAVIAIGGSLIGCLGLLDDHRSVSALSRFAVEGGVAAVALAVGLRVHATDIAVIDGLITIIWIVGVTNAVNLLDNMDGSAAGISCAAAAAIFVMAVLGEEPVTATLAAGVVGACLGFLAHNKRPASIFMGDTGSLFLGFVLAIATIDMSPALKPPGSFAVPLMLLALPVLDTATVVLGRLRHGRSVALGGKDHLSHRLVKQGVSPGLAVALLVAVEGVAGTLAVLAGRDVLPLSAAIGATVALIGVLASWTAQAHVYVEEVVGLPRRVKRALLAGMATVFLLAAPALLAMGRAHGPGVNGARAASQGLEALRAGDATQASGLLEQAADDLARAEKILDAPVNSLGLAVPVVRANIATTRAVVAAGRKVAGTGHELSSLVDVSDVPLRPGSAPARDLDRLAPALDASTSALQDALGELAGYGRPYLWPSLGTTVRELRSTLAAVASEAATAAKVARIVPAMLGQNGPRRYFLAVQDNTEMRGTGGVIHSWGELEARDGRLRLTRFGPVDNLNRSGTGRSLQIPEVVDRYRDFDVAGTWQNVNVSPDFSLTARAISELYPQSGGTAVDGVVAVDLPGLAALLKLAGAVQVEGWPEPLTGQNLVDIVVRDSHVRYPDIDQHRAFTARVAETTVRAFTEGNLGNLSHLAATLYPAVRAGHLMLYAVRPPEQGLLHGLSMAGEAKGGTAGDSLMVVNQNLSATGIDSYLQRHTRYDALLHPGEGSASVRSQLEVTLRNQAPATTRLSAAENRTYLSVLTPLPLVGAMLDGRPTTVGTARELGRNAYSTMVSVPLNQTRTVALDLRGQLPMSTDGWYRLGVRQQVSLLPAETDISVSVPSGWRIIEAPGLEIDGRRRRATARFQADGLTEVAVRLQRTPWNRLWRHEGN